MPTAYRPEINARVYATSQLVARLEQLLAERARRYNGCSTIRWQETDKIVTELKRRWQAPSLCLQARLLGPETKQVRRVTVDCPLKSAA